ncbi:hypothetical protein IQ266_26820 [filamentous cyanobacterium LEGE 11480]|uniref:Uncharacterized protein n=1 Tax=Romeriopsis navalis LEGE 11480 TaxID=2777977 RepID=A0A928VVQ3_9CYAN|nr:hypothetical protein [Romeriopsis navalis]MBE9033352.1 hypothetical protein [Romeriopsis navalis LEGE 11480]
MIPPNFPNLDEQAKNWLVCAVGCSCLHFALMQGNYQAATKRAIITAGIFSGAALIVQAKRST